MGKQTAGTSPAPGATTPTPPDRRTRAVRGLMQALGERHGWQWRSDDSEEVAATAAALATVPVGTAVTVPSRRRDVVTVTWTRAEKDGSRPASTPRPRTGRSEARPSRPAARRAGATSATSSSDPGDGEPGESEPPAHGRRCAAPWCDHRIYGSPQQRYCGTERCARARAKERQRTHRAGADNLTAIERQQIDDARVAGYVGDKAFGIDEHALSFLWKFALTDGVDPGEYEALRLRACRCNGHHIDGGVVGCFKCGLSRSEVVACS